MVAAAGLASETMLSTASSSQREIIWEEPRTASEAGIIIAVPTRYLAGPRAPDSARAHAKQRAAGEFTGISRRRRVCDLHGGSTASDTWIGLVCAAAVRESRRTGANVRDVEGREREATRRAVRSYDAGPRSALRLASQGEQPRFLLPSTAVEIGGEARREPNLVHFRSKCWAFSLGRWPARTPTRATLAAWRGSPTAAGTLLPRAWLFRCWRLLA